MVGIPDYDTYVQHVRLTHPELTPMTYEEFYRDRVEARYGGKNGKLPAVVDFTSFRHDTDGVFRAGKTTSLLIHLLEHNHGERIKPLLKMSLVRLMSMAHSLKKMLMSKSLNSAMAVCCSIRGELTQSLHELLAKIDSGAFKADRLLLETTGLADPAPIVQAFLSMRLFVSASCWMP